MTEHDEWHAAGRRHESTANRRLDMKRAERSPAVYVWVLVTAVSAGAVLGGDYVMDWYTADGGGAGPANASTGGGYPLSGTIGQPDAQSAVMQGGDYTLTGGFWAVVLPPCSSFVAPDFDRDCDVDLDDLAFFEAGVSGPRVPVASTFKDRDFDGDGDVDADDFGIFQRCYSGAGHLPDPHCAE